MKSVPWGEEAVLRAPVAAAFFLLCEAYGIEFRDGVRPPIAFELAAVAMDLLDPWSGIQDAISDELRERITSRKSELVRALHGADLAWWHAPLDRDHQIWLTDDTSAEPQTVCPSQPPSEVEKHIQRPLSGLVTSTAYENTTALHAALTRSVGDWEPTYPLRQVRIQVASDARIFEVAGPEGWYELADRFRSVKRSDSPSGAPVEIVPDWHLVAEEWDAVHLSFAGSVMATFVGIEQGGQRARLWAWTTESTVWLRNVFTGWTELEPLLSRPQKTLYTGRFENDLRGSITDDSSTRLRRIRWWHCGSTGRRFGRSGA